MYRALGSFGQTVGWFEESLPKFLASHPESFLFIHVDCDLYSSTKTILDLCGERVVPGTILVFDEFFNYPNWQQGEFQAFQEFIAEGGKSYRWLGYCSHGQQVAVQIV